MKADSFFNRHRRLSAFGVMVASFGVCLLMMELVLRMLGIGYPILYQRDAEGLGRHRPGVEGWIRGESNVYVKINSRGLRDRERAIGKQPGTLRVAVLGDSYTQGLQVELEQTFVSVLERMLASRCAKLGGRSVEGVNFGVSGFGTAAELLTLRADVWKYEPDVVVLAFLSGNDVRNNSEALERDPTLNYFVLEGGKLQRKPPSALTAGARHEAAAGAYRWLVDRSYLLQLVRHVLRSSAGSSPQVPLAGSASGEEVGLDSNVYKEPVDPNWADAWAVTEALILEMNRDVRQRDRAFFVATLSNGIQVHRDVTARAAFARELGVPDLHYPDRRVGELLRRNNIPHVILAPKLATWSAEQRECVHGFNAANMCRGHWNPQGHRIAGELMADAICDQVVR